jgi:asparagine synthase (glutamine-hydrolysing)
VKFTNRDALPDNVTEYIAHPWEVDMEGLPTGKKFHVKFVADVLNRHRPIPRVEYAYEHHPLLSQPLIELSLQIPTYLLLRGGRQRALARETFRDRVPEEICGREDKGDAAGHIREALRRSESFLCDILLDGLLVQWRIVRSGSLEPYFRHGQPFRNEETFPLLASIAAELWARNWRETSLRVAA